MAHCPCYACSQFMSVLVCVCVCVCVCVSRSVDEKLEYPICGISSQDVRYLLDMCKAVEALHSKGMVHCDIKTANGLYKEGEGAMVRLYT